MTNKKREVFLACEDSWFDGDCSGDRTVQAVCLGNLTLGEIFEVFESAVDRKVAEYHSARDYYESEYESITFQDKNFYLNKFRDEISKKLKGFLSLESLGIDISEKTESQKKAIFHFREIICDHLDITVKTHFETYPVSPLEIDSLFESKIMSFLGKRASLSYHISHVSHSPYYRPASQNEVKESEQQQSQLIETIFKAKSKIKNHLATLKASLLQQNSQLPILQFSKEAPGGYCCGTTYKVYCRELTLPEPNWTELQLQDHAFRVRYPVILEKLINNQYQAVVNEDILAKALSAVELLSIPRPANMPSTEPASFKDFIVDRICNRFNSFVLQITKRHAKRRSIKIKDEYDVQDVLHAILKLFFDDIRPEEWTPSYAGASSRMDFLLKSEQIVIETKMARAGLTAKKLGEELMVDKERYKSAPDCKHLVCFVYDPEHKISNPRGLENDLSEVDDSMTTTVLIRPLSD